MAFSYFRHDIVAPVSVPEDRRGENETTTTSVARAQVRVRMVRRLITPRFEFASLAVIVKKL